MKKHPKKLVLQTLAIATLSLVFDTTVAQNDREASKTTLEEITVYGRKLDAQLSIEAKRNAKRIIDAISSDEASRLPDNNIAESLGRIPGVTFERSIESGNGNFISIRGLDSALNNIQIDGVNSAVASAGARRTPLDGITAEDIAEIRVAKSLLPQDEGAGIGGSVEIISKTPLKRGKDRLTFEISGREQEFSDRTGYRFSTGLTEIINDKVGIDFSASFRRREIKNYAVDSTSSNLISLAEFRGPNGQVISAQDIIDFDESDLFDTGTAYDAINDGSINPDSIGFETQGYELQDQTRDTISLSTAIDFQITDNTLLTLHGRYNKQDTSQFQSLIQFETDENDFLENDDGDVILVDGRLVNTFDDAEIRLSSDIEDSISETSTFSLSGETDLGRLRLNYQASYSNAKRVDEPDLALDFDTGSRIDDGDDFAGNPFNLDNGRFLPAPNPAIFSVAGDPNYADVLADFAGNVEFGGAETTIEDSRENDRYGLKFDAEYDWDFDALGGTFNVVRAGVKFERSEVERIEKEFDGQNGELNLDGSLTFDDDGDLDGNVSSSTTLSEFEGFFNNVYDPFQPAPAVLTGVGFAGIPILDESAVRAFNNRYSNAVRANQGILTVDRNVNVQEDIAAFYVQSEFEIGNLTLIGGVRVERYEGEFEVNADNDGDLRIENIDPNDPGETIVESFDLLNGQSIDNINVSTSNTEVLPRITALYRLNDHFQIRAGYGESLARPSINQLADEAEININLGIDRSNDGDTPLFAGATSLADIIAAGGFTLDQLSEDDTSIDIESGNINLENAQSRNFDLSFEYYPFNGTAFTAGLFYKDIDNFIFINEEPTGGAIEASILEAILSSETLQLLEGVGGIQGLIDSGRFDITTTQPRNGDNATVKGIELGLSHQLDWAPGILANMGFNANITFTKSDTTISIKDELEDDDALVIFGFNQEGDRLDRETPFFNAPRRSANASIYYDANGLEVAISGSYQDRSFNAVDDFGLDQYDIQYFRFDFYAEYDLPEKYFGDMSIAFEVPDFTDTGTKTTTGQSVGTNRNLFDNATFNGREFRLTLRGRF